MRGKKTTYLELLELLHRNKALLYDPEKGIAYFAVSVPGEGLELRMADGEGSPISSAWWKLMPQCDFKIGSKPVENGMVSGICVEVVDSYDKGQ